MSLFSEVPYPYPPATYPACAYDRGCYPRVTFPFAEALIAGAGVLCALVAVILYANARLDRSMRSDAVEDREVES